MIPGTLERRAIARSFARASAGYEAAATLQGMARTELLSRLAHFRLAPRVVLDLGAGTGAAAPELRRRFPSSLVVAIDLAPAMLMQARNRLGPLERWWDWGRRRFSCVAGDASRLPLADGSVDLVFTNLMLQWCDDLDGALAEIRRVLAPNGLLLCSTFAAGTLQQLRAAWAGIDAAPHVNDFVDLHDFGAALVRAGFNEPVLDVDRHLRWYADTRALMTEIRSWGAVNAARARRRGLTGRRQFAALEAAYQRQASPQGKLPASWELLYASAFAAADPIDVTSAATEIPHEHAIPLGKIGRRGTPR